MSLRYHNKLHYRTVDRVFHHHTRMDPNIYNSSKLIINDSTTFNTAMSLSNLSQDMNADMSSSIFEPFTPTVTAILLSILVGVLIMVMYMYYLVLRMAKRDNSLLNCLLPSNALTYLIGVPIVYIFLGIIGALADPAAEVIGIWFCHVASGFVYAIMFKAWLFSLLASILRYLYIVRNGWINEYGLARVERILHILSWSVPIILMSLHLFLRTDYDPNPLINHCYGRTHESSSNDWWYNVERQFCVHNSYGVNSVYIEYGLRVLCGVNVGVCVFLFSNVIEAFVYYRVYAHLTTANEERDVHIATALSENSWERRKRRERLSLQINMLGWIVESIGQYMALFLYVISKAYAMALIMAPFYWLMQGVLVPFALLLNERRIKTLILDSGWLNAFKSVFNYNQNAVTPQAADNLEMGPVRRNRNDMVPANAISQSVDESNSHLSLNRQNNNASVQQIGGSRQVTCSAVEHDTKNKTSPSEEITEVSNYNQNAVSPHCAHNLEICAVGRNTNDMDPVNVVSQSVDESNSRLSLNTENINTRLKQVRDGSQITFAALVHENRNQASPPEEIASGQSAKGKQLDQIEEEEGNGIKQVAVEITDNFSSKSESPSSSNSQLDDLVSPNTKDNVQALVNGVENKEMTFNASLLTSDTEISRPNLYSNAAKCKKNCACKNCVPNLDVVEYDDHVSLNDSINCQSQTKSGIILVAEAISYQEPGVESVYYKDNDFQTFCRRQVLNKLINFHDSDEVGYVQLFKRLLTLENNFYKETIRYDNELFMALLNKWLLDKKKKLKVKDTSIEEVESKFVDYQKPGLTKSSRDITINDLLHKMLTNVCDKEQYLRLLKQLYDVERSELEDINDEYSFFINDR